MGTGIVLTAIGLMSGTSMDGVDVALVETDGEELVETGPTLFVPYDDTLRALLRRAIADAAGLADRKARPGVVAAAEEAVTAAHLDALGAFFAQTGLLPAEIDVIGFHGQTVLHAPERGLTVQLGDGERLARGSTCPVVFDLRAADVAAGGEGAPLVPVYHRALVRRAGLPLPAAVINIGGVANVTWVGEGEALIAFDTGPGNALLDDLLALRTGARMDTDGLLAASGTVDEAVLARLLDTPYFARKPPKSLDRDAFDVAAVSRLSTPDAAATLTAFTAATIANGLALVPEAPASVVVTGGGAANATLMAALAARLAGPVTSAAAVGWDAGFIEAQAFAYLAVRHLKGRPLTFPGTTGVPRPQTGGVLAGRGSRTAVA